MSDQPKTNRPPSDAFHQQKLKAWKPIMTPIKVVIIFIIVGVCFIPAGVSLLNQSNKIYENIIKYDSDDYDVDCRITEQNEARPCTVTFTLTEDVEGPLYLYYGLNNYYQNHRRYVSSLDAYQLAGDDRSKSDMETTCVEFVTKNDQIYNPCGLIANSLFTDIITLPSSSPFTLDYSDISWKSDDDKYKQPKGFKYQKVADSSVTCEDVNLPSSCKSWIDPTTNENYLYYYPKDDSTIYLYESYPKIISPIEGVDNPHFKVWMRTAALPNFRKLYAKIKGPEKFSKNTQITFNIEANYEVNSFEGEKSIIISNLGTFGGKNPHLGTAFIIVGSISLGFAFVLALKQFLMPRPKASEELLKWD